MRSREVAERRLRRLTSTPSRRRRRRTRRVRRALRHNRRWLLLLIPVVLVLAALAALAWRDVRAARIDLVAARSTLTGMAADPGRFRGDDGRAQARAEIDTAIDRVEGARRRLEGSVPLSVVTALPGLRSQRNGAVAVTRAAEDAARVGRRLLEAAEAAAAQPVADGTVPLAAVADLESATGEAAAGLAGIPLPPTNLWLQLGEASRDLRRVITDVQERLAGATDALRSTRSFLGEGGPRTYLLAVQNNAEMRAQGMVLSYAVLRVEEGSIVLVRNGRITDLAVRTPVDVPIPPGTDTVFGELGITGRWQNANATADFSLTGRIMQALYARATGERVDGIIALDVPALARLLEVLGPVTVPGLTTPVTSDNAAQVLLHDLYQDVPPGGAGQEDRYEQLGEVTGSIVARLHSADHDPLSLGLALATSAQGGHFRLYSADADEQAVFERHGLSGGPAAVGGDAADRTFHVSVQNGTATKLDYFIRPRVAVEVSVDEEGTATMRTRVVVTNPVPFDTRPSYQVGPDGLLTTRPGQYRARVYLWSPAGAEQLDAVEESGLVLSQQTLPVGPASEEEVVFTTVLRNAVRDGRLELRWVPQPRLEAVPLEVTLTVADGWSVTGARDVAVPLDRPRTVGWDLRR